MSFFSQHSEPVRKLETWKVGLEAVSKTEKKKKNAGNHKMRKQILKC